MTAETDIDKLIYKYFAPAEDRVSQAMKYCLDSGGKRVRPSLLLETARSLGCVDDNICRLAVALECIHTYSLVHDDLPCMDNDDFRRGKPSCHRQFDEATAVLCGDALLNLAMEIVSGGTSGENYLKCVNAMFSNSGFKGMIRGQILDLAGSDSFEGLKEIAVNKTAKMIVSAISIPAIYMGLPQYRIEVFGQIGTNLGVAYQVADDLLDEQSGENSFVTVIGKERSAELLRQLTGKTVECLRKLPYDLSHIEKLALFNLRRQF